MTRSVPSRVLRPVLLGAAVLAVGLVGEPAAAQSLVSVFRLVGATVYLNGNVEKRQEAG
jgi:hypothetical protein